MKICLICAMSEEASGFRAALTDRRDETVNGLLFSEGMLESVPVVVVQCGVGKVNAALCTQTAIFRFCPDYVINVGVAGGVGVGVRTGCAVIADDTFQYDFDLTELGEGCGKTVPCDESLATRLFAAASRVIGPSRLFRGRIATGDRFVGNRAFAAELRDRFGALACEMEGGAVAQVCLTNGVPCGVLRAISDNANESSEVDFPTFLSAAVRDTERVIREFLRGEKEPNL